MRLRITAAATGPLQVISYLVACEDSGQALLIDPGGDSPELSAQLRQEGWRLRWIFNTHGHADHICALAELHRKHPAPVYIHAEDLNWCFGSQNQIPPYYPVPEKPAAEFIHPKSCHSFQSLPRDNGASLASLGSKHWKIPGLSFQTLETPGHTRGGVCYYFEKGLILQFVVM